MQYFYTKSELTRRSAKELIALRKSFDQAVTASTAPAEARQIKAVISAIDVILRGRTP